MKTVTYWIYNIREDDLDEVHKAVEPVLKQLKEEHLIGDYESSES